MTTHFALTTIGCFFVGMSFVTPRILGMMGKSAFDKYFWSLLMAGIGMGVFFADFVGFVLGN
jgi:hypothetical protein